MANFQVYGNFEIRQEGISSDMVAHLVKDSLFRYYAEGKITAKLVAKGYLFMQLKRGGCPGVCFFIKHFCPGYYFRDEIVILFSSQAAIFSLCRGRLRL